MTYIIDSVFNKKNYDERIDFIKGYCILCVVLNHCIEHMKEVLFPIWGSPAVALFILIQVFHAYKKGPQNAKFNLSAIWKRILKPFLFVQFLLIFIWLMYYDMPITDQLKLIIYKGGKGPGSYYVWIYIQIAFLLPLFATFLHKTGKIVSLFVFILISQLSEILLCALSIPNYIYVLLCFRYIFIIYLGYLLTSEPFKLSSVSISLSILSLLSLMFFSYCNIPVEPFFYNHCNFTTCHWICYFYVSTLLLFLLIYLYKRIHNKYKTIAAIFCLMGKQSYNIFLLQMFYFSLLDIFPIKPLFSTIATGILCEILIVIFSVVICVIPIILYSTKRKNET